MSRKRLPTIVTYKTIAESDNEDGPQETHLFIDNYDNHSLNPGLNEVKNNSVNQPVKKKKKTKFVGRYFQDSWKEKFPWVERDPKGSNLVFCRFCTKFLKPKITNIQDHAKSKRHKVETSNSELQDSTNKQSDVKDHYSISLPLNENNCVAKANLTTSFHNKEEEAKSNETEHFQDGPGNNASTQCSACFATFDTQKDLFFHLKLHYDNHEREAESCESFKPSDGPIQMKPIEENHRNDHESLYLRFYWLERNSVLHNNGFCKLCDEPVRLTKYYLKKHETSIQHMQQTHPGLTAEDLAESVGKKPNQLGRKVSSFKKVIDDKGRVQVECPDCLKPFKRNSIWVHLRIHQDLRPHKCHLCSWAFRQSNDLKSHINAIHERLSDYQCEICGSSFTRLSSLRLHKKIHSDQRDVICDICKNGFRSVGKMKEHRRIHTGERPYSCEVCSMNFRVKSDMVRHRTNVHEKGYKKPKKVKKRRPRKTDLTHNQHLQHHQYYTLSQPPQQLEFIEHVLEIEDLAEVQIDPYSSDQIIIYSASGQSVISQ